MFLNDVRIVMRLAMKLKTNRGSKTYTIIRGIRIWISVLVFVFFCIATLPSDSSVAKIIGIRYHHHPKTLLTRVVFEIDGRIGSHRLHSPKEDEIEVCLYNMVTIPGLDLDANANEPILKDVLMKAGPSQSTILNLTSHRDIHRYKLFPLSNPNRIVIDLFGVVDPLIEPQPFLRGVDARADREQNATLSSINPEKTNESSINSKEAASHTVFQNREVQSGEPVLNIQELLDQDELVFGLKNESEDISTSSSITVWWMLLGTNFLSLLGLVVLGSLVLRSRRALRRVTNQEPVFSARILEKESVQEEGPVSKEVVRKDDDKEDFEEILEDTISRELDTSGQPISLKRAFVDHSHATQEEELTQVREELDSEDTETVDAEEEGHDDDQSVKNKITELLDDDEILLGEVLGHELEEDEKLEAQEQRLSRRISAARRLIDEGRSYTQIARELKSTREEIALMLAIDKRS